MINYNNRRSTKYILMLMDQIERTIAAFYTFDSTLRLHTEKTPVKHGIKEHAKWAYHKNILALKKFVLLKIIIT